MINVVKTFDTNNSDFLARQRQLFASRIPTTRESEENYAWVDESPQPHTLQYLFEINKFIDGGWYEAVDDQTGKTVKSCGAYLHENSLVFGVRYCTFDSEAAYSHVFINHILPASYHRACTLGVDSMVLTVNDYNRHLPRMFKSQLHSEKTSPLAKSLLARLQYRGEREFNHIKQNIYSIEFAINSDYWYKENHVGL